MYQVLPLPKHGEQTTANPNFNIKTRVNTVFIQDNKCRCMTCQIKVQHLRMEVQEEGMHLMDARTTTRKLIGVIVLTSSEQKLINVSGNLI